ncbi:GNAT family N-acetyltransferase [Aeromicrobium phragmitis]|uniref:GNAT family N-acetyltransferase n=1 Tax=Aeromicrobium phragmitis TaxID=2478914 RepID=UPI001408D29E|nr:GNAT family N-acetyltransferase [Aeromicrobium phragmitis]
MIERLHDNGAITATSPYGYSGLFIDPQLSDRQVSEYWQQALNLLRERQVVSLFLRFHPLDTHSVERCRRLPGLAVVRSSVTYATTICEPETMWWQIEGRARTEVRKALKSGMTADVTRVESPSPLLEGSPFRLLYEETMRRVNASNKYFFDDHYFSSMASMKESGVHLAQVRLRDETVASAVIIQHGERAHYHLSGSDRSAARLGANSLMLWTVMRWCHQQQLEVFHLGGGVTEGDGLARFKRSFADLELQYFTGRAVLARKQYQDLTRQRAEALAVSVDSLESTGYFPAFLGAL